MSMTASQAIQYIENQGWSKTRLGLGRTSELVKRLGDPQKSLKFIHIAGSNGKGSTASMLESILRKAGYCTGLYTSPHLVRFNERIRVNGEEIPDVDLAAITDTVALEADKMSDHPSQFEISTAIASLYFLKKRCDIVMLEVGMGGEMDSTNVIPAPEVAVITNIGLDHTEYLGDTIEKIALAKAGIIKPGSYAVCFMLDSPAFSVIENTCERQNVPLRVADFNCLKEISSSLKGQDFSYRGDVFHLALCGRYQSRNAAVVLETIEVLRHHGWQIPSDAVRKGLSLVKWPARFEILSDYPLVILDGGHNVQCAEAVLESINELLPDYRLTVLLGMLKDKDYPRVIEILGKKATRFICLTPDSPRALSAGDLAGFILKQGMDAIGLENIGDGIQAALTAEASDRSQGYTHTGIIIFGSLYLAGRLREEFITMRDPLYP